jgi:acyl-CoA thioesterase
MSDLEKRLDYARRMVGGDPWAAHLSLQVEELAEGRAVVSLRPQAQHLNSLGRVHGSVLYALADQAMAVAANTLERPALIVEGRISFVSKAEPDGKLVATAVAKDLGRSLSLWEVEITDGQGKLIAQAGGRGYHAAPKS